MKRDVELDCYRGLAILWVLFIHSIYWMGFFTSTKVAVAKSYLLFEMPLLFFITGASNSLSAKKKLFNFYIKRIKRIAIPYWVYAFICVFFTQITITFLNAPGKIPYIEWFTFGFRSKLWTNIPYLISHLWFVPIYLLIIIFIPLLKYMYTNLSNRKKLIPLIAIIILVALFDRHKINNGLFYYYIKNVLVYSFWVYLGLFYSDFKGKKINRVFTFAIAILSYFVVSILIKTGYNPDMQINKFPPNIAFLVVNIGNFSILILIKKYIINLLQIFHLNNIVAKIGRYSYTVYLYQPFGFLLGAIILSLFKIVPYDYDIIGALYYWIINIFTALISIKIFGSVEKITVNTK